MNIAKVSMQHIIILLERWCGKVSGNDSKSGGGGALFNKNCVLLGNIG